MSDTPRTDNAICVRRWTERQGECAHVPCEQLYVEPDFARELERELAQAIVALESGFMPGTYARLQSLQDKERELAQALRQNHNHEMYIAGIERDLARMTAERDAALADAKRIDRLQAIAMANGELYVQRIDAEGTMQLVWAHDSEELGDTRKGPTLRFAIDAAMQENRDG